VTKRINEKAEEDQRNDYQRDNFSIFASACLLMVGFYVVVGVWQMEVYAVMSGIAITCIAIICMRVIQWIWNIYIDIKG